MDTASGHIGKQPGEAGRAAAAVPAFAKGPVIAVALLLAVLLIAFSGRYGYHRDELYFLACGRHLAWGYPDQPPLVPVIARLISDLAPASLVVLRLPAAVASAALVLLTGLIARELGAERAAQALAAVCVVVAPLVIGAGHLLSTTTFDLPAWALAVWLILRILRTGNDRLWLVVGLVAGAGLFDSDLIAFLVFAIVVGLAVAWPRRPFRSPWLYAGGAIALAMRAPYLAWQASHGWPELAIARSIASGGSGTSAPRWALLPYLFVLTGGYLSPVWVAGLARRLQGGALRWCRALGAAFIVLLAVFTITGGKPYYLGGMFPVLLAAGAQPAVDWIRRGRARLRAGLLTAAVILTLTAIPVTLPVVPATDVHRTPIVAQLRRRGDDRLASLRAPDRGGVPVTACGAALDGHRARQQLRRIRCRGSLRAGLRIAGRLRRSQRLLVLGATTAVGHGRGRHRLRPASAHPGMRHAPARDAPEQPPRRAQRRARRPGMDLLSAPRFLDCNLAAPVLPGLAAAHTGRRGS